MSDDSLETQVANKIDKIVHTENFKNMYNVHAYSDDIFSVKNKLTNEIEFDLECGYYRFIVALPNGQRVDFASNQWIYSNDYNKNELLFEESSNYEKMENAYGFLHHVVYPNVVSWWDKTSPEMRRIYSLFNRSNLNDSQDQKRIIHKIHNFIASTKFKQSYNIFNENVGYSVYYKDYEWFRIYDCYTPFFGIIIEMSCNSMVCNDSLATWNMIYEQARNLYHFIASLAKDRRI